MHNAALELFDDRLLHKPYFSDDLHFGVRIAAKERAIPAKYIQFNQPHAMFLLGLDVDRNAPAPTLINPNNGQAHQLLALKTSIRTAPDGKMKPLSYGAVENALRKKLEADAGYSRLISKDPKHGHWKIVEWQSELYTLDWPEYNQWLQACYERASAYNLKISVPLDENEVRGTAKSIAKWTHLKFTQDSFPEYVLKTHTNEIQSLRSNKSKEAGRPCLGNPWEAMEISRRTYFRYKKKGIV
ncbi:replication initiation protein [Enterobacter asburiae]|uniref:replication initiation protein n=1 Tax=Enterobacter asburiae TaxID=61645 RepID=UPI001F154DC3|nr:replication initiation protein [Enterobacter asburiae]HDR2315420.1 replication initiation protein [Enterobacter asburiae]